jgi:hypothetical protein
MLDSQPFQNWCMGHTKIQHAQVTHYDDSFSCLDEPCELANNWDDFMILSSAEKYLVAAANNDREK